MDDWRNISSAPRNGSVIEIEIRVGRVPWRGLFHFSRHGFGGGPQWYDATSPNSGLIDSPLLVWRPFSGVIAEYAPANPPVAATWEGARGASGRAD